MDMISCALISKFFFLYAGEYIPRVGKYGWKGFEAPAPPGVPGNARVCLRLGRFGVWPTDGVGGRPPPLKRFGLYTVPDYYELYGSLGGY